MSFTEVDVLILTIIKNASFAESFVRKVEISKRNKTILQSLTKYVNPNLQNQVIRTFKEILIANFFQFSCAIAKSLFLETILGTM